jgi:hypothetical protein
MNNKNPKGKLFSRRGILPIIGGSLLVPFLASADSKDPSLKLNEKKDEYQTLLKPDGTAVKVKISTLKNARVIKKNVSNKSFLNWLGKK